MPQTGQKAQAKWLTLSPTWTLEVCKIMAPRAVIMGLGLLFHILLGFR